MSETKYNGWSNYATWRVNLELFDCFEPNGETTADDFKYMAIEAIEIDCEPSSLAFDYALAFLDDVNWHEIAEHHKTEE